MKISKLNENIALAWQAWRKLGCFSVKLYVCILILKGNLTLALQILIKNSNRFLVSLDANNFIFILGSRIGARHSLVDYLINQHKVNAHSNSRASDNDSLRLFAEKVVDCYLNVSEFKNDKCIPPHPSGKDDLSLYLELNKCGRLSNFLLQLANALEVSRRHHINSLFISDKIPSTFNHICNSNKRFKLGDIEIILGTPPRNGYVISSQFFHLGRGGKSQPEISAYLPNFLLSLKNLGSHIVLISDSGLSRRLVIHIRSSDVFNKRKVHPGYGQPPLSYYKLCIEHFCPNQVTIVCEDRSNPVIPELESWLLMEKLSVTIQCSDLWSDLKVLNSASAIVLSRGTFSLASIALNRDLKRVYSFGVTREQDPYMRLIRGFNSQSLDHYDVIDKDLSYSKEILRDNWRNSVKQRSLMIGYPKEKLEISRVI